MQPRSEHASAFVFNTVRNHTDVAAVEQRVDGFRGLYAHLKSCIWLIAKTRDEYEQLSEEEQKRLKNGPCVIFASFNGKGRTDAAVTHVTALGLDVDEVHVELPALRAAIKPYSAIIYESARSVPGARRWRVVLEYAQPLTVEQHAQAFDYWATRIPGVATSVRNPSRVWYVPTRFAGDSERVLELIEGEPFAWSGQAPSLLTASQEAFRRRIGKPAGRVAVEGERNNALSAYAASIVSRAPTEMHLAAMLSTQNQTYLPPLPSSEVVQITRSTWRKRAKFGWQELKAYAQAYAQSEPAPPFVDESDEPGFELQILSREDPGAVPWLVSDLLTHGAHLLVGRPKGGKSWTTLELAFAVASGGTFLGKQCRRGSVLWFSAEDTRASLARRVRARKQNVPRGVTGYTMEDLRRERCLWDDCEFHEMLRARLVEKPVDLVIIDTQKSCEAQWLSEKIDKRRMASAVDIAYQSVRVYEEMAQDLKVCIVLVHHTGKQKNNRGNDYHERINMPATVVAGVTGSLVLADPPDRDLHAEDDFRRVLAIRGRHISDSQLLVEICDAQVQLVGKYSEVVQSREQAELLSAIEALLEEQESTSISEVANTLGKHKNGVQRMLSRLQRDKQLIWKGKRLSVTKGKGIRWV